MSEEIKEAKKCLEKISKDEEEIRWAELREKYVLEINTAKVEAREEGFEEGKEDGKREGIKEGIKEGKKEGERDAKKIIAKNMLKLNIDIETIAKSTGLAKEDIQKLNKEI